MSNRFGGVGNGPYASLNLGTHVGDDPVAVAENRRRFSAMIGAEPVWMNQVHGNRVVDAAAVLGGPVPDADAAFTDRAGVACTVLVADCLPVLLAARNGRAVGAAHAGWRGLAGGVVENALAAVCQSAGCSPADIVCWLGPCIGPGRFEVGEDVLRAFAGPSAADRFVASADVEGQPRWRADLAGLARDRLRAAGVVSISGGTWCTVEDTSRFFSYRRDRRTGRLAAAVWLRE